MERSPGAQPDLRSVLDALWRRRWLFLGILVSIPVVVYVVSTRLVDTYETRAIISTSTPTYERAGGRRAARSPRSVRKSCWSIRRRSRMRRPRSWEGPLGGSVKAEPLTTSDGADTGFLQVTATAGSGQRAADLANAYATAIDEVRTGESVNRIDRAMAKLEAQADETNDEAAQAELTSQLQSLRCLPSRGQRQHRDRPDGGGPGRADLAQPGAEHGAGRGRRAAARAGRGGRPRATRPPAAGPRRARAAARDAAALRDSSRRVSRGAAGRDAGPRGVSHARRQPRLLQHRPPGRDGHGGQPDQGGREDDCRRSIWLSRSRWTDRTSC